MVDACYFEEQLNQCFFIETEMYERLVFVYAQTFIAIERQEIRVPSTK